MINTTHREYTKEEIEYLSLPYDDGRKRFLSKFTYYSLFFFLMPIIGGGLVINIILRILDLPENDGVKYLFPGLAISMALSILIFLLINKKERQLKKIYYENRKGDLEAGKTNIYEFSHISAWALQTGTHFNHFDWPFFLFKINNFLYILIDDENIYNKNKHFKPLSNIKIEVFPTSCEIITLESKGKIVDIEELNLFKTFGFDSKKEFKIIDNPEELMKINHIIETNAI